MTTMSSSRATVGNRTVLRTAVVWCAALAATVLAAPCAHAASDPTRYTCDYSVGETAGTGSATASFDSGIEDGLVVTAGARVSMDPFTGSVTLPQEFTDALRKDGLTSIQGSGSTFLTVRETGDKLGEADFAFDTDIPATGALTAQINGEIGDYQPPKPGTYTVVTDSVFYFYLDPEGPDGDSGVTCTAAGGEAVVIDAFTATPAATPTTTVTATATAATPVRPAVVQTDFADDEPASPLPLAPGLGVIGLTALAAAATATARRSGSRRH